MNPSNQDQAIETQALTKTYKEGMTLEDLIH